MQTDPLGKLGAQLSKRPCTFRWRCFQTAAVWKQEQRQALSLESTHPKKVNQRIPLDVYPPRMNEVPRKKIPVTGYIRRRAATDQIDTALVVGPVVCPQIAEGYHLTSIKLLALRMQLSEVTAAAGSRPLCSDALAVTARSAPRWCPGGIGPGTSPA